MGRQTQVPGSQRVEGPKVEGQELAGVRVETKEAKEEKAGEPEAEAEGGERLPVGEEKAAEWEEEAGGLGDGPWVGHSTVIHAPTQRISHCGRLSSRLSDS